MCFENVVALPTGLQPHMGPGMAGGSHTPTRPQHRPAEHLAFMGVQQGSLSGWRNMIYWILVSHSPRVDVKTVVLTQALGESARSQRQVSSREEACAWHRVWTPRRPKEESRAAGACAVKSRRPGEQVLSQADLPPPPLIQFFLQATFSCVALLPAEWPAATLWSWPPRPCAADPAPASPARAEKWFAAPAATRDSPPTHPTSAFPTAPTFSIACFRSSPGVTRAERGAHAKPRRPAVRLRATACAGSPWSARDQRGDLWTSSSPNRARRLNLRRLPHKKP